MKDDRSGERGIGEILVEYGVITRMQLDRALKVQAQNGGRLGSTLVELGALSVNGLLDFLGKHFGVPTANLHKVEISPEVLATLPLEQMLRFKAIPLSLQNNNIFMAMVEPNNMHAIGELEFMLGRHVLPVVVPYAQIEEALAFIAESGGKPKGGLKGSDLEKRKIPAQWGEKTFSLDDLFRRLLTEKGCDLLLSAGVPPCLKVNNQLQRLPGAALTPDQVEAYALELMNERQREEFEREKEIDFSVMAPGLGRVRINIYRQRKSLSIAARHIHEKIPTPEELGLPAWVRDFVLKRQGLILVTGPTGHGKTTTLASLVDIINTHRRCNIITLEDPIEYLHSHKGSNINQREIGIDTSNFGEGLRHIFRQAPDVIVIGEMRDPESFAIALQAAETGHLVLSTVHSTTATSTIERIVDIFPANQQPQIRVQLAESFLLILNQRLVSLKNGSGRVLACEKLVNSARVRTLIRDGKTHQIRTMLQRAGEDFDTIDSALAALVRQGRITASEGLKYCSDATWFNGAIAGV